MFFVVSVASYSLLVCLLFQMEYKVKPFFDCCLSFLGFSTDEQKHMEELTVQNGNHTHASTHTLDTCAHSPHLLFLLKEIYVVTTSTLIQWLTCWVQRRPNRLHNVFRCTWVTYMAATLILLYMGSELQWHLLCWPTITSFVWDRLTYGDICCVGHTDLHYICVRHTDLH